MAGAACQCPYAMQLPPTPDASDTLHPLPHAQSPVCTHTLSPRKRDGPSPFDRRRERRHQREDAWWQDSVWEEGARHGKQATCARQTRRRWTVNKAHAQTGGRHNAKDGRHMSNASEEMCRPPALRHDVAVRHRWHAQPFARPPPQRPTLRFQRCVERGNRRACGFGFMVEG